MDDIKKLREKTGAGIVDCKKALDEAGGDFNKALEILRKKGQQLAVKKQERSAKEGLVGVYVHTNGQVAALVEVNCETDFVARSPEFQQFVHDLAMQVVAMNPLYLSVEEISRRVIAKEKEIYLEQLKQEKKPVKVIEKIIEGKLEKYYQEVCLLKQPFIKDDKITIEELLNQKIAKIGENIVIKRFVRYSL
jgi:elongation factor Ts